MALTYISQPVVFLYRSATQQGWWPSHHSFLHVMASILIWGALDLDLLDTSEPAWPKYHRSWILSCLFEAILCILESVLFFQSEKSRHGIALFALQVFRVKYSIALGLNANVIPRPTRTRNDAENQWLLAYEPTERAVFESTPTSQSETENGDAVTKERQRKRLEEQGWFAYIKEFRVFLPCLWPSGSIRGKLCLAVLILDLVINRFLRVLTPRQLGIITDKLIAHDFDMACYEVGIWVLFSWLRNTAGPLGLIKSMALQEVQNFSYQEVCHLVFKHVMTLSMDFHSNKDSAEIIKAVEQGNSIGDLAKLLLLDVPPVEQSRSLSLKFHLSEQR
jgi:hypothetical protein